MIGACMGLRAEGDAGVLELVKGTRGPCHGCGSCSGVALKLEERKPSTGRRHYSPRPCV